MHDKMSGRKYEIMSIYKSTKTMVRIVCMSLGFLHAFLNRANVTIQSGINTGQSIFQACNFIQDITKQQRIKRFQKYAMKILILFVVVVFRVFGDDHI